MEFRIVQPLQMVPTVLMTILASLTNDIVWAGRIAFRKINGSLGGRRHQRATRRLGRWLQQIKCTKVGGHGVRSTHHDLLFYVDHIDRSHFQPSNTSGIDTIAVDSLLINTYETGAKRLPVVRRKHCMHLSSLSPTTIVPNRTIIITMK